MPDVDVVMITKNSMQPCLVESLDSIENAAKKCTRATIRLIVVDKASTDGTIEEVRRRTNLNPLVIADDDGNRATARQKGIEAATAEYIAFVDSDVVLTIDWFCDMLTAMEVDGEKGAIWGITIPTEETELEYRRALAELYRTSIVSMAMDYGMRRGMTHDTLIRRAAVEGIKIPKELHVFEDHYIRQHIEKQGYEWDISVWAFCYHNRHTRIAEEAYQDAYYGRLLGVHSRKWLAKHVLLWPAKLLYLAVKTRNRKLVGIEWRKERAFVRAAFRLFKEWILRKENSLL